MGRGLLCLTLGHKARFAVPKSVAWGDVDSGRWGEVCFGVAVNKKIKYGEERFSI